MVKDKKHDNCFYIMNSCYHSHRGSIHCGCGTHNYIFIWAMGGENKEFDDMDHIKIEDMK